MDIWVDSREKERAVGRILEEFERRRVGYFVSKLYVGDYMSLDNARRVIDRKQNLLELCSNVVQDHRRFVHGEVENARAAGIQLIVLCEHGGSIKTLEDVAGWVNPRLRVSPMAVSGERLYRILKTIKRTYGVEFLFCNKAETGGRIIELLGGDGNCSS